jgi:hypothetical protein
MHEKAENDLKHMILTMSDTAESKTKLAQQELLVHRLRTSIRDIEEETFKLSWVYKEPYARKCGLWMEIVEKLHMWNQDQIFSGLRKVLVDA